MRDDIRNSTSAKALAAPFVLPALGEAMDEVRLSVDRFCLLAGIATLQELMEEDATAVGGPGIAATGTAGAGARAGA